MFRHCKDCLCCFVEDTTNNNNNNTNNNNNSKEGSNSNHNLNTTSTSNKKHKQSQSKAEVRAEVGAEVAKGKLKQEEEEDSGNKNGPSNQQQQEEQGSPSSSSSSSSSSSHSSEEQDDFEKSYLDIKRHVRRLSQEITTSCTNMSDTAAAIAVLEATSWFHKCSPDLLGALAGKMQRIDAENGHIFMQESSVVDHFFILEQGVLQRSKLHIQAGTNRESFRESMRNMKPSEVSAAVLKYAVPVDTLEGRGCVTGLLHNMTDDNKAYATVTAKGKAVVWTMKGTDFREVIGSKMEFLWEILDAMANELRSGSKSLRTLMLNLRNNQKKHGGGGEDATGRDVLRVLVYDTTSWVSEAFKPAIEAYNKAHNEAKDFHLELDFTAERLGPHSATYAAGYEAICTFVNDTADADTMQTLSRLGVKMIAQRAAGFDRVDTKAARAYGMTVARVPAYSPYAVAEMAIALLMAVNRKTSKASNRVKMANFTLDAGLMGMDIHGKTVGVMGTGKIGAILCNIVLGFGANLICYDVFENEEVKKAGGKYVSKDEIFATSDILFLMMPLLPATKHTINDDVLPKLKKGVILINTSRGGLINTKSLLKGLHNGVISGVGIDVYENEQQYFFQDWSAKTIQDADLTALLGEPSVVMTAHQAFFTKEAVDKITNTTLDNLVQFKLGKRGIDHPNNCIPNTSPMDDDDDEDD